MGPFIELVRVHGLGLETIEGEVLTMALSPADVAHYRRHGYLAPLPGLSAEECGRLREEIEAFGRRHGVKEQLVLRNKAHLKMPALAAVVHDPRIIDAVEAILGPDILCWGSSLFIKEPGGQERVGWHQDVYYYDIENFDVCTAWVALIASTRENGALRVIPGTHTAPAEPHGPSPANSTNMLFTHEEILVQVDEDSAVELPLETGQFSLHHVALVHGSAPNRSADRRMGFAITYLSSSVRHHGRRTTGLLVRGKKWGRYMPDPVPTREMDPDVLAFVDRQFGGSIPVEELTTRQNSDVHPGRTAEP